MSNITRPKSTNAPYAVDYGRPPVGTHFTPGTSGTSGTSGNRRGRPPKVNNYLGGHAAGELSALHKTVLNVAEAEVEIRRGEITVRMT